MSCRLPGCDRPTREDGQDLFANKFCSIEHEIKYDHLKDDARDARLAAMDEADDRVDRSF